MSKSKKPGDLLDHATLGPVHVIEYFGNATVKAASPVSGDENADDENAEFSEHENPKGLYYVEQCKPGEPSPANA